MAGKRSAKEGQLSFGFDAEKAAVEKTRKEAAGKAVTGSAHKKQVAPAGTEKSSTKKTKAKAKKVVEVIAAEAAVEKEVAKTQSKEAIVKVKKAAVSKIKKATHIKDEDIAAQAEAMALQQRDISVSEFFAKNRHLLGFDNPSKALLTAVKEAVDNSLDACEESCILPDIEVGIQQRAENRFRMWVQDNGPGIPFADQERIFDKFTRLKGENIPGGLGVGLAFCRLAVTGHGGRIWVESKPGEGARFILSLPVVKSN